MLLLSHLWAKILFDFGASHSFVVASSVDVIGLEVETLDEPLLVSSPLGTRVRIDQICRDYELEILREFHCSLICCASRWHEDVP